MLAQGLLGGPGSQHCSRQVPTAAVDNLKVLARVARRGGELVML